MDASAVHPESYSVVKNIAEKYGRDVASIIGDVNFLKAVNAADFVSDEVGLPTVKDILSELEKPGRDPRPEFVTAEFKEGVEEIKDLRDDMILEGVVSNVAAFGAFVDIGVHQDGLVHISMMSDQFISDPREVVKAGDVVKVKVMEVDLPRRRIGLTMRMNDRHDEKASASDTTASARPGNRGGGRKSRTAEAKPAGGMAALFAKAQEDARKKGRM